MTMRIASLFLAAAVCANLFAAAPRLANQPQPSGIPGLKIKTFENAESIPAVTPPSRRYTHRQGSKQWEDDRYQSSDLWRLEERGGAWKNRFGDELEIALCSMPPPSSPDAWETREDLEKSFRAGKLKFASPTREKLVSWISVYSGLDISAKSFAKFQASGAASDAVRLETGNPRRWALLLRLRGKSANAKGPWVWVEFRLAQPLSPKDGANLLGTFLKATSYDAANAPTRDQLAKNANKHKPVPSDADLRRESAKKAIAGAADWWFSESPDYVFLTDMPKTRGAAFIKDTTRLMEALRKAYSRYIPASHPVGTGIVRIFSSAAGYQKYIAANGANDLSFSIGLWDPSREELLVQYLDDKEKSLETMRHEAFHQYLHYATKCANHMMWFNEGHATLFENIRFNSANSSIRVLCKGNRADWVARDISRYANLAEKVIFMDRSTFLSSNINDHYVASWLVCYFLQKGRHSSPAFAAYSQVIPEYLDSIKNGLPPEIANERAWRTVEGRSLSNDLRTFWHSPKASESFEP